MTTVAAPTTTRTPDRGGPAGGKPKRRMRRLTALVAAVVIGIVALTGCAIVKPPGDAPLRYRDQVFSDVTVTHDLQYGSAVNSNGDTEALKLDLYQPTGDTVTKRPAVVWVHGGGFSGGDKGAGPSPDLANKFAKLGYVTVSINYRLTRTTAAPAAPPRRRVLSGGVRRAARRAGGRAVAARQREHVPHRHRPDRDRRRVRRRDHGDARRAAAERPGHERQPRLLLARSAASSSISGGLPASFRRRGDAPGDPLPRHRRPDRPLPVVGRHREGAAQGRPAAVPRVVSGARATSRTRSSATRCSSTATTTSGGRWTWPTPRARRRRRPARPSGWRPRPRRRSSAEGRARKLGRTVAGDGPARLESESARAADAGL